MSEYASGAESNSQAERELTARRNTSKRMLEKFDSSLGMVSVRRSTRQYFDTRVAVAEYVEHVLAQEDNSIQITITRPGLYGAFSVTTVTSELSAGSGTPVASEPPPTTLTTPLRPQWWE